MCVFAQVGQFLGKHKGAIKQIGAATVGLAACSLAADTVYASGHPLHPPKYDFSYTSKGKTFDAASVRRGFEVYQQVCSTCHSLDLIYFRNLVGVTHTKEQAKALAAQHEIVDGPNDEGNMFERPRRLTDYFPKPYENDEQARFINGGALPPDLSLMTKARHDGDDYTFSLLTGYCDAPAGVQVSGHYNPYFPGGSIAMAPPLTETGQVEFEDGTVSTPTQCAKDVTTFLNFAGAPEHDRRSEQGLNVLALVTIMALLSGYHKRFRFSVYKTAKLSWRPTGGNKG